MKRPFILAYLLLLSIAFLTQSCPNVSAAISPTAVATASITSSTTTTYQRKMFEAATRQWLFYSDGTNLVYKTSLDGFTWTSATTVVAVTTGDRFDVKYDGTYMHYARATEVVAADVFYRSGTPNSDGSITWRAAEQTVYDVPGSTYGRSPVIAIDSGGYPFVSFCVSPGYTPWISKSSMNNGTWATAAGFPYQLSTDTTKNWFTCIVALSSNQIYVTYYYDGGTIRGRLWSGSAWGSAESVTTSNGNAGMHQLVVTSSDTMFLTFTKKTTYDIIVVNGTAGAWEPEHVLDAAETSDSFSTISIVQDNIFVFWQSTRKVYYAFYVVADARWTPKQTLSVGTINIWGRSLTSSLPMGTNKIMVAWQDSASSPYDIRYMFLDTRVVADTSFMVVSEYSPISTEPSWSADGKSLTYGVTAASSAESCTRIWVGWTYGAPRDFIGSTAWSYNSTGYVATVNKTHSSEAIIHMVFDFTFYIQVIDANTSSPIENASVYYFAGAWNSSTYLTDPTGYTPSLIGRYGYTAVVDALNYTKKSEYFTITSEGQTVVISLTAGLAEPIFDTRLYVGGIVAVGTCVLVAWWYRRKTKSRSVTVP